MLGQSVLGVFASDKTLENILRFRNRLVETYSGFTETLLEKYLGVTNPGD